MSLAVALVVFVASAAALMGAGAMLATAGDELAEKTGLGGLFVGALIVGPATSLPEIATDVTAVVAGAPDLAVADLFGSSMANMAILAIIDLHHRGGVWPAVELGHARVAAVAIMLTSFAVLGTLVPPRITLGWVGPETVLIAVLYVAAMAWLRRSPPRWGLTARRVGVVGGRGGSRDRGIGRSRWCGCGTGQAASVEAPHNGSFRDRHRRHPGVSSVGRTLGQGDRRRVRRWPDADRQFAHGGVDLAS